MYLIIRADGNSDIGMGHLMRCSAIADEIEKAGGKICFLVSPDSDLSAVTSLAHSAYQLKKTGNMGWDVDEAIDWITSQHAERLLVDSYRVDAKSLKELNQIIDTYYMDDLYAFDYPVGHIINHNIEASIERYRNQTYVKDYYLGVRYFPVRKQILEARKSGVAHEIKKTLVTTGATDPYEIELKLLEEVAPAYPQISFTFLLGAFYNEGYINKLLELSRTYNNITVLGWTKDMGRLYAENDLTIGPGSTSLLESMTVGTAAICFSFVDNHLNECLALDEMHIAPYCGDVRDNMQKVLQKISEEIAQLNNREKLEGVAARYRMLFDGHGAERTAEVLMNGSLITEGNAEKPIMSIRDRIKSGTDTVRGGYQYEIIHGSRASAILYNFLLRNDVKGKALIPANICETIPATYLKAGVDVCLCDIDFGTWLPDEKQIWAIMEENPDITVLHYNRTYGCEANRERFFHEIHLKFPKVIIVDDRCLAMPFQSWFAESDLVLYSTGKTKPVNVGKYAFGYLKPKFAYTEYSLKGDIVSCEKAFDDGIKYCHTYHTPADMKVMLSNWMNPEDVPGDDYDRKIEVEYKNIVEHKRKINSIYSVLPDSLPNEYQNWRFNILVANQDECLKALFAAGLFASKHYMSLGNGYFSDVKTPSTDWLESHVINLFNDNCYTEDMANKTVDILKKVARRL